jgi:diguanylate cyclase (GGDEF)-like protein
MAPHPVTPRLRKLLPTAADRLRRVWRGRVSPEWAAYASVPAALALTGAWEVGTGGFHWLQLAAVLLAAISMWGRQPRASARARAAFPVIGTLSILVFAMGTSRQPVVVALLFAVGAVALAVSPSLASAAVNCAAHLGLYVAVVLMRSSSAQVGETLLGAVLIALIGGVPSLIMAQHRLVSTTLAEQTAALRRQVFEQSILLEINRSVHNLQAEDTLRTLVEVTAKVMGTERTALLVADPDGRLNLDESVFSVRFLPGQTLSAWLSLSQQLFASILAGDRPVVVESAPGQEKAAILVIPLRGEEGPIGVLAFDHDAVAPVGPNDEAMLKDLAQIAVLAIENGRLHARVRRMADHDGLTDIYNHRFFQERLRNDLARAAMVGQPVALIVLEVDQFKAYNDRYGHQRGDVVLKSIAFELDRCARAWQGCAARYGGDEFVVIMPGQDRATALELAGRLLEEVTQGTAISVGALGLPAVTVSVGVATYPDNGSDASALINAADQAMYCAKERGGGAIGLAPLEGAPV